MKFGRRADLAYRLATLLPLEPREVTARTLIVPVPLHLLRLCERGFNPSALMARCFANRAGATFAPRLLERLRHTPQQSSLPARERRHNVASAFRVRDHVQADGAAGRQAILVDDVVTTGSTILACSRALYAAGVVHVRVIALARASSRA
jgi:ComF family protein